MNKDKARDLLTQKILDLTLEIIFLLTGEDDMVVKIHEIVTDTNTCQISEGGYCRTKSFSTEPPPHSGIHDQNNEKILELTKKIIQLLTGEVPIRCEDVSVYLSMEEWEYVERHKDLYKDITRENHRPVMALDKSVSGESHTPVSLSDSGNKSITNNVEQHLNKQTKGRAESATNTDQESLVSGEEQVPNKTNYSTIKCTEYSPSDIKQEPASWEEEENLTDDVINKSTENILATYTSYKGSDSHKRGDIADPDIYFLPEDTQTEYPSTDIKKESPIDEGANHTNTDVFRPPEHTQAAYIPHTIGVYLKSNTNLTEIRHSESLIVSIKPGLSTYSTDLITHSSVSKGNSASSDMGKAAYSTSDLVIHEINCRDEETFSPTFCGEKSTSVRIHQHLHTEEQPFSCSECEKLFTNQISLKKHQRIHTRKKTFICNECWKCFSRATILAAHKMTHTIEEPFKCTECERCFTLASSLAKHKIIHTGVKPFNCTECGKCFHWSSDLAIHKRIHTGEKPYKCTECGKNFNQASNLARHTMIHTGEKPFKCNECGKCFQRATHLTGHKRIHTGEKPFKCPECGKCFTVASSLAEHIVAHTGEYKYKCTECGKCFTRPSKLAVHKMTHTGKKNI